MEFRLRLSLACAALQIAWLQSQWLAQPKQAHRHAICAGCAGDHPNASVELWFADQPVNLCLVANELGRAGGRRRCGRHQLAGCLRTIRSTWPEKIALN
eukprot:6713252-Prymnesium_polylepis.5